MIRNLKVLLAAALALTAFGAIAGNAHAAEEFHCSVTPCRGTLATDGTGKTAHHVFIVENEATTRSVSFTCESLRGHLSIVNFVTGEVVLTGILYDNCTVNGAPGVEVRMNGCEYTFPGAGGKTDAAKVKVICPAGKVIEIRYNTEKCDMTVSGGFEASGVGYTAIGTSPNREVTATVNHVTIPTANIKGDGTETNCLIDTSQKLIGTYTTGNTLITGETEAGVMADAWYE